MPAFPSRRIGTVNNVTVATTSTAAASAAFGSQTTQIRIAASAACFFTIAAAPTAVATDVLMPANTIDYITVSPGQKISVFSPTIQVVSVNEVG